MGDEDQQLEASSSIEQKQPAEPPDSSRPILTERGRRIGGIILLGTAILHVIEPKLAIDGVFLGLIAFAAIAFLVDIESIDALGIKGRIRQIKRVAERVRGIDARDVKALTPAMPSTQPVVVEPAQPTHRRPFALNPPINRLDRLIWGAEQIRIELILLAGNTGRLPGRRSWDEYSPSELAASFSESRLLPAQLTEAIRKVTVYRNRYAHSERVPSVLVEQSADLAMDVLAKLREIERNYIRVRLADVPLFKDAMLSAPHEAKGVMIEILDSKGESSHVAVYPRLESYVAGRFVSWEWRSDIQFTTPAWYFDVSKSAANVAFGQALAFAGREYPEQWGIKFKLNRFEIQEDPYGG